MRITRFEFVGKRVRCYTAQCNAVSDASRWHPANSYHQGGGKFREIRKMSSCVIQPPLVCAWCRGKCVDAGQPKSKVKLVSCV